MISDEVLLTGSERRGESELAWIASASQETVRRLLELRIRHLGATGYRVVAHQVSPPHGEELARGWVVSLQARTHRDHR